MANPPRPRKVVLDDLDPLVQFDGAGWFTVNDAKDPGFGNFGPTYLSTLHGTNTSAELSFTFDGSYVKLSGSNNIRNVSGVIDPTWECLVDGVDIGASEPFEFAENNWPLCEWKDGTPGQHTLTVQAKSQGQTFWVDRMEYVPSPKAGVPDGSVISVPNVDNAIKLGDGWAPLGGDANMTSSPGATAEVEFIGTMLTWRGYIPNQFARAATTGTYAVDGGPANSFVLKGLTEKQPATYNQKFFETPLLSLGPHRVLVVYQGNSDTTPLTLTNLLIEGGNSTAPLPGDPSVFDALTKGGSKVPIGAIVGGVVGGLAVVAATIIVYFVVIRRRKAKDRARADMHAVPFDPVVDHPSPQEKGSPNANNNGHTTPMYTPHHALPHHNHNPNQIYNSTYPSPPVSTTNTSSAGANFSHTNPGYGNLGGGGVAAAQPLRKGQIIALEARNQGSSGYTDSSANDSRVVLHQDSGVRMDAQGNMIEVPPLYSAQ
ncbi:hypothetical protein BKA70DRAFT_1345189 [Coprinopsis sp. MPI-PUGE-AT-0042]|nr:hypothetical protein BKA70DRAFT_1345189 [Coprinopsis sp. MPI-PUGE-AT-0042]